MVLLSLSYCLLKQVRHWRVKTFSPSKIVRGKDSVKDLLPYTIVNIKKSHVREPAPGFKRTYSSVLFGRNLRVRATLGLQRKIHRVGGFDRYIYYTPEEEFKSQLAIILQKRMKMLTTKYPSVEPPPLDKRNPKPLPKKLAVDIRPTEVSDVTKYVYLG